MFLNLTLYFNGCTYLACSVTPIQFVVFDIVYFEGKKVRLPLIERKALLEKVIPIGSYNVVLSKWIHGNGIVLTWHNTYSFH